MKRFIKYIIIFIILVIIAIVICLIRIKSNNKKYDYASLNNKEEYIQDAISVQYLYAVMNKYRGNTSENTINKTYYNFAKNIVPKYYNLNINDINKYYEKNKIEINKELGIINIDDFNNFYELVKTLKNNERNQLNPINEFVYEDTIKVESDVSVYFGVEYENNQLIVFNSRLLKSNKKDETAIVFNANVDNAKVEEIKAQYNDSIINKKSSITPQRGVPVDIEAYKK